MPIGGRGIGHVRARQLGEDAASCSVRWGDQRTSLRDKSQTRLEEVGEER